MVEFQRLGPFRQSLENMLLSPWLPTLLAACHVVNIVAMTIASAGLPELVRDLTHYINIFVTGVFALKTLLQVVVLGFSAFSASWSRVLEGIVTLISVVRSHALLPSRDAR